MTGPPAAFYCVADARYFLGAVAMINSLRLNGHREPIYLLDAGLSDDQRELLAQQVRLVASPYSAFPMLLSTIAPVAHPAEVMVLIDADMVVTRSLAPLIERAAAGRVVAFQTAYERFVAEWGELLELGPIVRRPYVCAGLALYGGEQGRFVLELLDELAAFVELDFRSRDLPPYPADYQFVALEQDVLNAILASSRVSADLGVRLEYRLAPSQPYGGLRVSAARDSCAYADGTVPFVLHHLAAKPWIERQPTTLYSRLLSRYLLAEDLPLRVAANVVPVWLRDDARGRLARLPVDARERAGWIIRDVLPRPLVERLDARRRRRVGLYR